MKKLTPIYAMLTGIALISPACLMASEEIGEAFGKTLGSTFAPSDATSVAKLPDGTPSYQFSPKKPIELLNEYHVLITPKTHTIYSIQASSRPENVLVAKKQQELLMTLLTEKYGPEEKYNLYSLGSTIRKVGSGNRYILTTAAMDANMKGFLQVAYIDEDLQKLAEEERLELVDAGGL